MPTPSRPLRVLMVSDVYFPRVNGVSTSMETFRSALAGLGVELRLVVPRYGDEPDSPEIVRIPGRPVPGDPEDRLVGRRAMREAAVREAAHCDLVHVQTPFVAHGAGVAAARAHGLPLVSTYHTFFEEYLHHYAPWLPARLLRALARRVSRSQCNAMDAVVVPSTAMRDRLASYGVERTMHVLPTGVPARSFAGGERPRFRAAHGIDPAAPVALYVGRLAHEKNIGFLLEAAARLAPELPGFVFVVAGEGPARGALERQVAALGLTGTVRFVGYLDRTRALPDCYAAADAFVFASRTETQGLVLVEAMAAGLPVVALAEMGTRDILAGCPAARVSAASPEAFARALLEVLGDADVRRTLAGHARAGSTRWDDVAMAARLAGLYRSLAARGTPAAGPAPVEQLSSGS